MLADFPVVLDSCVLAEAAVSDLLLRLSEEPRLVSPRWTLLIWEEVRRTWLTDLAWPSAIAESRISAALSTFPEALVKDFEPLMDLCTNREEDRHVLAAAIKSQSQLIVTANLKDFRKEVLEPWEIEAKHPSEYLRVLFDHDPAAVNSAILAMAAKAQRSFPEVLARLAWSVRPFAQTVADHHGIDLPAIRPVEWRR